MTVRRGVRVLRQPEAHRRARADRGRAAQGDQRPARLPARRRARLPDAAIAPPATLSGGEAQRIRLASQLGSELSGVHLRARRAVDRPAPARQRAADRDAAPAARPRQHRARRRARRRDDRSGRLGRRLRPGRRPPRRPRRRRRHARRDQGEPRVAHRPLPGRERAHRGAGRAPQAAELADREGRARAQPQERRRRDPARRDGRGHRRVGRGQVVADQRHAAPGAEPQAARQLRPRRPARRPSSASTRSTR